MINDYGEEFPSEDKPEAKAEGTLPVFIKQIHAQEGDIMKMWSFEYKMVTTVALVRSIKRTPLKILYVLSDITGHINAHLWADAGDTTAGVGVTLNTYARVIGAIRQQGDVKSILIYKIQPAKINEVNTHYMEVVNARYQAEEYYRGGAGNTTTEDCVKRDTASTSTGFSTVQLKPTTACSGPKPCKKPPISKLYWKFSIRL